MSKIALKFVEEMQLSWDYGQVFHTDSNGKLPYFKGDEEKVIPIYGLTYPLPIDYEIVMAGPRITLLPCVGQFYLERVPAKVILGRLTRLGSGGTLEEFKYRRRTFSHYVSIQHIQIVQQEDKFFNALLECCLCLLLSHPISATVYEFILVQN